MGQAYTAVIKREGTLWFGWIEEIPGVTCQEPTREALVEALRGVLKESLEFYRRDAREAAGSGYERVTIAL